MLTLLGTDRDGNTDQELQQALQHADQLKAALVGAEKAGLDLKRSMSIITTLIGACLSTTVARFGKS